MDDFESFDDFSKKSNKTKSKKSRRTSHYSDNSDFINMFSDLFNAINFKVSIFLFIIGILIFSDTFIETFLVPLEGAVDADTPTTKGTTIQLLLLTFGYIIIDLMATGEII